MGGGWGAPRSDRYPYIRTYAYLSIYTAWQKARQRATQPQPRHVHQQRNGFAS